MRTYLKVLAVFFILSAGYSCNEEQKNLKTKGYSVFCWPSKTPCENREYGLEFSYISIKFDLAANRVTEERVATLICCRYIPELLDTLTAYNDTLKKHRNGPLGNLDKRCTIGPYEIFVNMTIVWEKGSSISFFGFTDTSHPFGFTMSVPQLEAFDDFLKEVQAKYKKCCRREVEEQ